jgi:hypothetical protein
VSKRAFSIDDFSGGILEETDASAFVAQQSARAHGLVLSGERKLRSQFPLERLSLSTDHSKFAVFEATFTWIVSMSSSGQLRYMMSPSLADLPSQTRTAGWVSLGVSVGTGFRFAGEGLVEVSAGRFRTGLYLNRTSGVTNETAYAIYENDDADGLIVKAFSDRVPTMVSSTDPEGQTISLPKQNVLPKANLMGMWSDMLVAADVIYDGAREQHSLWLSQAADPDAWHPQDLVRVASPEARIVGFYEIDAGLLVVTTDASDRDGLILLRGTADDFSVERLRGGLGTNTAAGLGNNSPCTKWDDTGSVVYPDREARVWHTDGREVSRLDEIGPRHDRQGDPGAASVATSGPYVFISRAADATQDTLLCGRLMETWVAWTRLVLPAGVSVRQMQGDESCLYLTLRTGTSTSLWRFVTTSRETASPAGHIDGAEVDLTYGSATFGDPEFHHRKFWRSVGVRASSRTGGTISKVTTRDCAVLHATTGSIAASHSVTTSTPVPARSSQQVVVPALGPSELLSVEVVFRGDVQLEALTVEFVGSRGERR